jgi:hypothetical protein
MTEVANRLLVEIRIAELEVDIERTPPEDHESLLYLQGQIRDLRKSDA